MAATNTPAPVTSPTIEFFKSKFTTSPSTQANCKRLLDSEFQIGVTKFALLAITFWSSLSYCAIYFGLKELQKVITQAKQTAQLGTNVPTNDKIKNLLSTIFFPAKIKNAIADLVAPYIPNLNYNKFYGIIESIRLADICNAVANIALVSIGLNAKWWVLATFLTFEAHAVTQKFIQLLANDAFSDSKPDILELVSATTLLRLVAISESGQKQIQALMIDPFVRAYFPEAMTPKTS